MSDPSPENDEAGSGEPVAASTQPSVDAGCSEPDCEAAVAELYGYLDGHLDDDRRSLITGHLDSCGSCFSAFDFEAELRSVIATKCRDEVPSDLRRRIQEAINQDATSQES